MPNLASRSTREVFDDHLKLAQQGRFDEDITRNFSEDCVVLTHRGTFRGHDGLCQLAAMLEQEIPGAEYGYINCLVEGRFALLEWTADCGAVAVHDGADSFVVENGKVIAQTIHYTLSVRDSQALTGRSGP